jgi:hypothetical protein
MNTKKHIKIAGALQMVQGIPLVLFALWYIALLIPEFQAGSMGPGDLFIFILILSIAFLFGGVLVWFGGSLLGQKPWTSRAGGFICSAVSGLCFPHIIGIYTLWVLLQVNKEVE